MWKLAVIFGCLGLLGCGITPVTETQSLNSASHEFSEKMKANFPGHYQGACQEMYFRDLHLYAILDEVYGSGQTVTDGVLTQRISFYLDGSCQIEFGQAKLDGTYEFYKFLDGGAAHSGIAFQFSYEYFVPATRQIATLLVERKFCDRRDWIAGQWTNMQRSGATLNPQELVIADDASSSFNRNECSTEDHTLCDQVKLVRVSDAASTNETPDNP